MKDKIGDNSSEKIFGTHRERKLIPRIQIRIYFCQKCGEPRFIEIDGERKSYQKGENYLDKFKDASTNIKEIRSLIFSCCIEMKDVICKNKN